MLKVNINAMQQKIYANICDNCGKDFNQKQHLIYHAKNNVCFKKFSCKYYTSNFKSTNAMYKHMRDVCKIKKRNGDKEIILKSLVILEDNNKKLEKDNEKLKCENETMKYCMKRVIKSNLS